MPRNILTHIRDKLTSRNNSDFIYIHAPILPVFHNDADNIYLEQIIKGAAHSLGADFFASEFFSLSGYLRQGYPFPGNKVSSIAKSITDKALGEQQPLFKVLVTDLDNVLWKGVIGEDGLENLHYHADKNGYKHYIYQTFLKKLQQSGVLLAAVSRNDAELALTPFKKGDLYLKEDDFVSIQASYNNKSAHIRALASELNLPTQSFVFIDDNPIEIEEVSLSIPDIKCHLFPRKDEQLPTLLSTLAADFSRDIITPEDSAKTKLYKQRAKTLEINSSDNTDLSAYLESLKMHMRISFKNNQTNERAVQLINKTNQFNFNGKRYTKNTIDDTLKNHGQLITAELSDTYGSHGEIIACLLDKDYKILSLVMSCRVFQRCAEYAFLYWLIKYLDRQQLIFHYIKTQQNIPISSFLNNHYFHMQNSNTALLNCKQFLTMHQQDYRLFSITDA